MIPQIPQKVKGEKSSLHIYRKQKSAKPPVHGLFIHGFSKSPNLPKQSSYRISKTLVWTKSKKCRRAGFSFTSISRLVYDCLQISPFVFTKFTLPPPPFHPPDTPISYAVTWRQVAFCTNFSLFFLRLGELHKNALWLVIFPFFR